jgi:hypothetical protein
LCGSDALQFDDPPPVGPVVDAFIVSSARQLCGESSTACQRYVSAKQSLPSVMAANHEPRPGRRPTYARPSGIQFFPFDVLAAVVLDDESTIVQAHDFPVCGMWRECNQCNERSREFDCDERSHYPIAVNERYQGNSRGQEMRNTDGQNQLAW